MSFTSCRYCSFTTDFPSVLDQHMADAHGLQRGVPEQPVEPAPPNRWKAFTDEELDAIAYGVGFAVSEGQADDFDLNRSLAAEIQAEEQRRGINR